MTNKWEGREIPNLANITELFSNEILGAFITGHLIIESLLVQLIEVKNSNSNPFEWNFPSKVNKCKDLNLITLQLSDFLKEINRVRNEFAHRLGYMPTFTDIFALLQMAANAGVEFSDDRIHENIQVAMNEYELPGLIQELFQSTAQELAFYLLDQGKEMHFFDN